MSIFIEDLPQMLPTKFWFIWQSGFRGEDVLVSANQKQELPVAAMFVSGSGQIVHFYKGRSIDAFYRVSVHLAKGFQSDGKSSLCLALARWAKKQHIEIGWKIKILYTFQICEISEIGSLLMAHQ